MSFMNAHRASLAVLAGNGDPLDGQFSLERGEFHGTAFCMTPGLFVTAAHVYQDARGAGGVALARLGPDTDIRPVRDAEVFPEVDLALMSCPGLEAEVMKFVFEPLPFLADVFAIGYAFGSEISTREGEPHVYHLRAFKGHVVTRRGLTRLPGVPPGYEVSFVPPPGLSGAALLIRQGEEVAAVGIVQTHHTAELAGRRMDLGLAVDSEELLTLHSRLVGGSIAEKLFGLDPVPLRDRRP
jgi:hypothetical protein